MNKMMTIKYGRYFMAIFLTCLLLITSLSHARDGLLEIQDIKTDKGITVWLVEDHSAPIISMSFAFRHAGSINESIEKQGLARLTAQMMTQGAGDLNATAFQKALQDASISLSFNADRDNFQGSLKTLTKYSDQAFELLKSALTQPAFADDDLQRLIESNQSRIRSSLSSPQWMAARIANDTVFGNHPYGLNSGGTLSSLAKITPDDLRAFKGAYLGQNNLIVAVTGDIDPETLRRTIDDVFSDLPDVEAEKPEIIDLQKQSKIAFFEQNIPQSIINIYHPGVATDDPQYITAQVMNYILGGGGFGSRLMEEIREKRGLTYGIYSGFQNLDAISLLQIGTSTQNENVADMLKAIKAEFKTLKSKGITQTELDDAKSYLIGSLPLSLTSTDKISGLLLSMQLNDRPIDYLDQREAAINALTVQDVSTFAKSYLDPQKFTTIVVGMPEKDMLGKADNIITIETLPNVE